MPLRSLIILTVALGIIIRAKGEESILKAGLISGNAPLSQGYRSRRTFRRVEPVISMSVADVAQIVISSWGVLLLSSFGESFSDTLGAFSCLVAALLLLSHESKVRDPSRLRMRVQSCIISSTPRKCPSSSRTAT